MELQPGKEGKEVDLERITNGKTAPPNSIPWQAFIFSWNGITRGRTSLGMIIDTVALVAGVNPSASCGGSLVSNYYAHCVTTISAAIATVEENELLLDFLWESLSLS